METFTEVLDALNARTGLSDRKLGVLLGAGEGAVTGWRTGRNYPRPAKLDEIARLLDLDPVHLRAMIEAEKTKDPAQRATWQRIAAGFAKVALLAFVTLGGGALHNGNYLNNAHAASALSDYTLQRIRRFIRWLMLAGTLPLAACAVDPYWLKVDDFTPTSVRVEVVDDFGYTGAGDGIEGTAFRDHASGECLVTILRGADRERVLAHEMKHCDGWDHPSYRVNLDGFTPPLPR